MVEQIVWELDQDQRFEIEDGQGLEMINNGFLIVPNPVTGGMWVLLIKGHIIVAINDWEVDQNQGEESEVTEKRVWQEVWVLLVRDHIVTATSEVDQNQREESQADQSLTVEVIAGHIVENDWEVDQN